jgi:hypothetical protein
VAARQHGVVSRAQCLAAGLSAQAIKTRIASGRLFIVHRGVYAVGHPRLTFEGRCMAAVLATGGYASHGAAAVLWGLPRPHAGPIDVVSTSRHRRVAGIHPHWTRSLNADVDVTYRRRVAVTNLRRTLDDLKDEQATRSAERIHGFDRDQLKQIRTKPIVLGTLEPRFLRIVADAGLPRPETNAPFGPYSLDAVWWDAKVAVEVDDWDTHRTRYAFRNDRGKSNAIVAAGLKPLRFTVEHLDDPNYVVGVLGQAGVRPG